MTAPAHTSPVEEPTLLGVIEAPLPGLTITSGRQLMTVGWVWSPLGAVELQISCDGQALRSVQHGLTRSDVAEAWPSMPDAATCGFIGVIDIDTLTAGSHVIVVRANAPGGISREWRREFFIGDFGEAYRRWLARGALQPSRRAGSMPMDWPLTVIVDAGASNDRSAQFRTLASLQRLQPRPCEVIVYRDAEASGSTSGVTNAKDSTSIGGVPLRHLQGTMRDALMASGGDWITLLAAGEVLHPQALQTVAGHAALHPACGLWYADHDQLGPDGLRHKPILKPAWSPVWFRRNHYIGHPWFGSGPGLRSLAAHHGEEAPLLEHDALRRLAQDQARSVGHIPSVLMSKPGKQPKPPISAKPVPPRANKAPRISVVIPSRLSAPDILARCLDGLEQQTHCADLEVMVVFNGLASPDEGAAWLSRWPSVMALYCDQPFNWSMVNNLAAERAQGELLLFLNDDIECITPDWLASMVALSEVPGVGAVGAVLHYPDGRIQHAGVQVASRAAVDCRHTLRFCRSDDPELQWLLGSDRDQSAVTGACLLTRREVFLRAGGFDERLALVLNDVDYCLRLGQMGLRSVVAAGAVLVHHEGLSRAGMLESEDVRIFEQRWQGTIAPVDPFHHPALRRGADDWALDANGVAGTDARVLPASLEAEPFECSRLCVEQRLKAIRQHFEPRFAPQRVLDLGRGAGRSLAHLAGVAGEVVGATFDVRHHQDETGLRHVTLLPEDQELQGIKGTFDLILLSGNDRLIESMRSSSLAERLFERLSQGGVAAISVSSTRLISSPDCATTIAADGDTAPARRERQALIALPLNGPRPRRSDTVGASDASAQATHPSTLAQMLDELQRALQRLGALKTFCEIDNDRRETRVFLYFQRA